MMLPERPRHPFLEDERDEERLPRIALVNVPHPRVPNLYPRCFEYQEPWQWSPEVELVETRTLVLRAPPGGRLETVAKPLFLPGHDFNRAETGVKSIPLPYGFSR